MNSFKFPVIQTLVICFALAWAATEASGMGFFPERRSSGSPAPDKMQNAAGAVENSKALTLTQAYALALKRSEDIAIKKGILDEAQGHFYQAIDVIMPKVNYLITDKEQEAPRGVSVDEGVSGSLTRHSTPERKFVFSQPIFSGFKEIAALQAAGAEKKQRQFEKERAEQLLFVDVMESFYAVLQARKDVQILDEARKSITDRMKDLKNRVSIGRSREGELQTSVSEQKVIEAELVEARRWETVSRQLLEFYIGRPLGGEMADDTLPQGEGVGVDHYLLLADRRPDVLAARQAASLAGKKVMAARSGLFPAVSVDGNYYTRRVGVQSGIDWDATFKVDVPVFNGTETIGDIQVAGAQQGQAEQLLSKTLRSAKLDIENSYENYISSGLKRAAYEDAAAALQKNYDLQAHDFSSSLVSNLDVIDALRRFQDTSRTANQADYDAKRNYWKLRIAAGESV